MRRAGQRPNPGKLGNLETSIQITFERRFEVDGCTHTMPIDYRILFVDARRDGKRQVKYVIFIAVFIEHDTIP
jgi:hypothetical protein